jgi:hypothetical protein
VCTPKWRTALLQIGETIYVHFLNDLTGAYKTSNPIYRPTQFHAFTLIHSSLHDSCIVIQISVKTAERPQATASPNLRQSTPPRRTSEGNLYSHVGLVLLGRVSGIHGRCGGLDAVTVKRKARC